MSTIKPPDYEGMILLTMFFSPLFVGLSLAANKADPYMCVISTWLAQGVFFLYLAKTKW